ncbi:VWD domain-containing protein [Micromonospora sp. NPDC092111]|uniref:VWD domain-containing protein n=1 Tax=Micromonospora sp. NPDC092111 TaxID=3364289 RepID=UPI0037F1F2C9
MGITIAAVLLGMGVHASGEEKSPATQGNLQAWHSRMVKVPRPSAQGCFTAAYPELVWQKTECVAPPSAPMAPNLEQAPRRDVGGGIGIVTGRPTGAGPITRAYGSFEKVNQQNLLSVTSVPPAALPGEPPSGPTMPGSYSFQLNTNHLRVQECNGSPTAGLCRGWKQFVFANDGTKNGNPNPDPSPSRLYVEYWLLHYNPDPSQGQPCPSGWTEVPDDAEIHCSRKTEAINLPYLPIQSITRPALRLDGSITKTADGQETDTATFNDGLGRLYSSTGAGILHVLPPDPQEPGSEWAQVEFNVFGYGRGSTARFNPEASFNVRTTIEDGSPVKPDCQNYGFSGERNNLNFGPPGPVPSSPAPAVVINESVQGPAASSACRVAAIIGDTHQYTFGGLFYDFQATGDFVEAQAGSTFEVQTRKVSGAPNWPNTSVNRSVAVRMGNSRLALCDGTRLVVNGTTTSLPAGDSLLLPTGVAIDRVNNVYTFRDPSGNSVRATVNTGYLDLGVGVGPGATTVRGLLGNPNGDPRFLEAKDGSVLRVPLSHTDLYDRFGGSWRVSPSATLLQSCNTVAVGNPTGPFYAGNLNSNTRLWAQELCRSRQVATQWLDTCALDVAVLGASAATVYVGLQRPEVDANPVQPPACTPGSTHPTCPTPTCSPAGGCRKAGG